MKYWLTVHYPPYENGMDKAWLLHVFLKNSKLEGENR